jgi:hypothetical protein
VASDDDGVLARRARIATLVSWGQRVGYGCFGAAIVLFVVGALTGFPRWLTTTLTVLLFAGSIVLAPAIVFHYGLRAAEREERERGQTGG